MGFGQAIQSYFQNYVGFAGRAPRVQMWWILLLVMILAIIAMIIDNALGLAFKFPGPEGTPVSLGYGPVYCIVLLGLFLPNLALGFRRLHDRNKSAWWLLLALIPFIGALILFIWMYCLRGTVGDNRFGPDPLGGKTA